MHPSAYKNAELFYEKYCKENIQSKSILDIGSCNVNGTLKPIFAFGKYIGLDMECGPNVDMVCDAHNIPLDNDSFDIIISSSCFEHDNMFWVTFLEMCRLVKPNGYIYICAPSNGPYHAYPVDNWRFYKDSWAALAQWAKLNNHNIELVESYVDPRTCSGWNDSVGIFRKVTND